MAYTHPNPGRFVLPPPQLFDPSTGAVLVPGPPPPPPPPAPLPPAGFFVRGPDGSVFVVRAPLRVDYNFMIRMDLQRTEALIQFMEREGLMPSMEEEVKRRDVVEQLKQVVLDWVKKVAWRNYLPQHLVSNASAAILPYGSYGLGVHGSDSDIDALCVGPFFATMERDFFGVLRDMLQQMPEVSDIHCVKSAKVPLMRFKFNGVLVDLPYAQLRVASVPERVDLVDPNSIIADPASWKCLSGVRANSMICRLVPNLENFQAILRCVKLWARRRGIYSHMFGFYGGIHLTILVAHVCRRHPNASLTSLLGLFFDTFSHWAWPEPVTVQNNRSIRVRHDPRRLMPIVMPCSPIEFCASNITKSTFSKIVAEFRRASSLMKDIMRPDFVWDWLFEAYPYTKMYTHFMQIFVGAPDADELHDWGGWVKSRLLGLLYKLEQVHGFCDPNPTEFVDYTASQPNTVFYWGLYSDRIEYLDMNSVKEEFMRSVRDFDYDDNRSARAQCTVELSIVLADELPKNVEHESGDERGTEACWRVYNEFEMRAPVYSQHHPQYVLGYVASDRECSCAQ